MSSSVFASYDVHKDAWYSPIEIIDRFELARSSVGDLIFTPEFKRAREMFVAAATLLGVYELNSDNKYFMQSNNQSTSPDVMAAKQTEKTDGILMEQTQMEVTELEEHFPSDDIVDFLLATKLSPKYGCNEHTMIVLLVNRYMPFHYAEVQKKLVALKPKPTIYIVGRPQDAQPGDFSILTAHPPTLPRPINYNVVTTSEKYSIPPRVNFNLGTDKKISYKKAKLASVNTYQVLGLDRDRIYKKYGKTQTTWNKHDRL